MRKIQNYLLSVTSVMITSGYIWKIYKVNHICLHMNQYVYKCATNVNYEFFFSLESNRD